MQGVGLRSIEQTYESRRAQPAGLVERMKVLTTQRPSFGYRRLHTLLGREGFKVNHKRVFRLYRLKVSRCGRRRGGSSPGTSSAPRNVVDDFSREYLAIYVDSSVNGHRVARLLGELVVARGKPQFIVSDNGPEFVSKALDRWAYETDVKPHFIRPGKPVENAFIESFNGRFRDECLDQQWFADLADARATIGAWHVDCNVVRPHGSLGGLTPKEYAPRFNNCGLTLRAA